MNIMYDTTAYGPYGKRDMIKHPLQTSLSKWLSGLPVKSNSKINTQCVGEVVSDLPNAANDEDKDKDTDKDELVDVQSSSHVHGGGKFRDWLKAFAETFNQKTKFCSAALVPKTFQQK